MKGTKVRVTCIADHWKHDDPKLKDPDLTFGKTYKILGEVPCMNSEPMYSVIGDDGVEIERPKWLFRSFISKHNKKSRISIKDSILKNHTQFELDSERGVVYVHVNGVTKLRINGLKIPKTFSSNDLDSIDISLQEKGKYLVAYHLHSKGW